MTTIIARDRLEELATAALCNAGVSVGDAAQVAQVLVLADLFGIHTHGVQRIPQYLGRAHAGGLDLHAKVVSEVVAPAIGSSTARTVSAR